MSAIDISDMTLPQVLRHYIDLDDGDRWRVWLLLADHATETGLARGGNEAQILASFVNGLCLGFEVSSNHDTSEAIMADAEVQIRRICGRAAPAANR